MKGNLNKTFAFIRISRPSNVLIAALTIFIAAGITGTLNPIEDVFLAAIVAALITIGANVINDYYDIQIDRINKPHRPLAAGVLSKKDAFTFFLVVYFVGWCISLIIGLIPFFIAVCIGILLFFYSNKFKRTVLWGNLIVSFASAMAFIFGGVVVQRTEASLYPALFAFLYHLGREIIKDMQDIEGDVKNGARTFAVVYGLRKSLFLTAAIFNLLLIITILPYILRVFGGYYMWTVAIGIYPVLGYVLVSGWKNPVPVNLNRLSNLLKADMLVGLLAIYLG